MDDPETNPHDIEGVESDIEVLARETGVPVKTVHEIYHIELAKAGSDRANKDICRGAHSPARQAAIANAA